MLRWGSLAAFCLVLLFPVASSARVVVFGPIVGAPAAVVVAPPAAPAIVAFPAPRPGWVCAPGYWSWTGTSYVWTDGHWLPARPGYRYVPAHWQRTYRGWIFEPGMWVR